MDIFDEVIAFLKASKDNGQSTVYLTAESRAILDRWATSRPNDLRTQVTSAPKDVTVAPTPVSVQSVVKPVVTVPVSHLPKIVGVGNPQADLMFVGEELWQSENQQPFSGNPGELLNKMTVAMKLSLDMVYRCSILKEPSTTFEQSVACLDMLSQQIRAVQPKVIVIMGALPLRLLTNSTGRLQNVRGDWLQFEGVPCMPTYHPEFLERCPNKKGDAWNDLQLVMEFLGIAK